ncbi:MAG TPA: NCS1 family nucleobase:cation symporter-1 [Bryobacteraceae bacterium]|nr:NCS1 family nucleobase:cation symporter-1 [Bryobacteraceae bacterium]
MKDIRGSALYNEDLAPVPMTRRDWDTYNYAALWVGMSVCIPTYMLASGLIAGGMNWWQAIGTILLGNLVVLAPMLLNAHAGTKYGIPFPVLVRASFGVLGANVPAILRALVACGWFGIQTWIGGQAINAMLGILAPGWAHFAGGPAVCFVLFWMLNMLVIWRGIETIKFLEGIGAPFMLAIGVLLLWWVTRKAGGFGPVLGAPSRFHSSAEFWRFFVPALTGMVGFWATVALNIPDFSRYARSQKAQMLGQALGLPTAMTLYSFIGVAVTSASVVIFGEAIWDPVALLGRFHQPAVAFIALIALLLATLNTNVAANVVSPSNDFSNLNPRRISFRTGGLITGCLGMVMMPWKLLGSYSAYIFGWLVGYSALLGPIAGVMIADYFVVRRRQLVLDDLYLRQGCYEYAGGFNYRALAALAGGIAVGLAVHDYAWFAGFLAAGALHLILMRGRVT